jgi:hypothetical protein
MGGREWANEERMEIECPDCGKKLMVLRIACSGTIEPAPVQERQDDRRAYSLREVAENAESRTPCLGEPPLVET